jgi:NAD(P)-dependent dehydrogenase (short-subunit alcohol dehydrogenase family)
MWNDFVNKAVLITGGTRGIGLACGLAFGRRGAQVTLTHKWGGADEDAIRARFAEIGAPPPDIVCADVANDDDTRQVLNHIRARHERLDVIVSNVAFAALVRSVDDYTRRGLAASINYSAWPVAAYTLQAREIFAGAPRYVVAMSSEGTETLNVNYDFIAASKAVLESLCRYLHYRLREEDCRVNVVRTRFVATESLDATFGAAFTPYVRSLAPDLLSSADEVAEAVFGVCSGLLDGLGGQVIQIDRGASFSDGFSRFFDQRHKHPLPPRSSS